MVRGVVCSLTCVCLFGGCSRTHTAARQEGTASVPEYHAAGVVPSGMREAGPLAPGRIGSIYGLRLGPEQPCHGVPDPVRREAPSSFRPQQTDIERQVFPSRLCDTEVYIGGVAAGLLYVSGPQVNFKVPQTVPASGTTTLRVIYKGQAGPAVLVPLAADSPARTAARIAEAMWAGLQKVRWTQPYPRGSGDCFPVAPQQPLRGELPGHAYYCSSSGHGVVAESFYFPADPMKPRILLMRADIRPAETYPELSVEVEEALVRRLTAAWGAGTVPRDLWEIGASGPHPGRRWDAGELAVFVNRNPNWTAGPGSRDGVALIGVRKEILPERNPPPEPDVVQDLERRWPGTLPPRLPSAALAEADRANAERETRAAALRLLRRRTGDREELAASLVAADELVRRLGRLLVSRTVTNGHEYLTEAEQAEEARKQLAPYGVRFSGIGHYSGDLEYDYALLKRAWVQYPETEWGQRAFLMLQKLSCATPKLFGCDGPNCFRSVIRQGQAFLERFPDTPFRREQTYHLALAHETWWSLAQAPPGDITAMGKNAPKSSAETARRRAIELYEELLRTYPGSREARMAGSALPRLKLGLDTAERTFFCFSC